MIYPIVAYGHPILKKKAAEISPDYPDLKQLVEDMFETMYHSEGVGLAAPQINLSIRLFVVDADDFKEKYPEGEGFKRAFVNPQIIEEDGENWFFNEGCLSVPGIHEDVARKKRVHLKYQDVDFNEHDEWFDGICARVIQHEYDHLEGKVFTDRLSSINKLLIKKKLNEILSGKVEHSYKMIFGKGK
ncbi:MAG: peptide deformylase [Bacteroidales bacterium]|nr:peptide deformylase [Bacteroidales bacterium]MBR5652084.1 peptide deformylase [Bacteroidales bacterium]